VIASVLVSASGSAASAAAALPPKAIPFAQAPAVSAGSAAFAIVVTVALLAAIAFGLWLARRNGWLRPWLGTREISAQVEQLKVVTRVRLSPTARAMVLELEGRQFLVVESSQHVVMHMHPSTCQVEELHHA